MFLHGVLSLILLVYSYKGISLFSSRSENMLRLNSRHYYEREQQECHLRYMYIHCIDILKSAHSICMHNVHFLLTRPYNIHVHMSIPLSFLYHIIHVCTCIYLPLCIQIISMPPSLSLSLSLPPSAPVSW